MVVLLAAAIGIMSAVFAHLIMLRLGMAQMRSYALTFLCGALVVVSITLGRTNSNWNVVTTLLLYGSWWFLFFAFVQMAESSLRVKILHILIEANGRLPREKLLQYYDEAILIEIRLARLLKSGAVVDDDGRLFLVSTPLRLLARLFRGLKLALLGRASEFESEPQGRRYT